MKNKPLLAFATVMMLALAGAARAQGIAVVKVPFPFFVNGTQLPAGTYDVVPLSNDSGVVQLISSDHRAVATTLTEQGRPVKTDNAAFDFAKYGNTYFLSRIDVPGDDAREIAVRPAVVERVLARLAADQQHAQIGGSSQQ